MNIVLVVLPKASIVTMVGNKSSQVIIKINQMEKKKNNKITQRVRRRTTEKPQRRTEPISNQEQSTNFIITKSPKL